MSQLLDTASLRKQADGGGHKMKFTFAPESKPLEGYTIKRAIHAGGFGEVYYALTDAGKEVALKLLRRHMDIELRGVSQCLNLKHANLVTIFDIKTDSDGDHWVVMEYISGPGLDEVLADHPNGLPLEDVKKWLAGLCGGLGFLHDRGIVHRDLKPANIFFEHGIVKIGDVGLSKFISESRRSAQTQSVGTVYYMAPEVAHGRYGHEVDVYALGVVLYELITGNVPFDGESAGEILMKHLSEKPDLTPLPARLRPVIARALEKDPLKRTPSAAELQSEFESALAGVETAREIPADSFYAEPEALGGKVNGRKAADSSSGGFARDLGRFAGAGMEAARHARRAARHAAQQARREAYIAKQAAAHAYRAGRHAREDAPAEAGQSPRNWFANAPVWLKILLIGGIVVLLFSPELFFSGMGRLFLIGLWGALVYGAYRLVLYMTGKGAGAAAVAATSPPPIPAQPVAAGAHPVPPKVAPVAYMAPAPRRKSASQLLAEYQPPTPRAIPLRKRMMDLSGSMTLAVIVTAVMTAALAVVPDLFRDPIGVFAFGVTALVASWSVLATAKVCEGTRVDSLFRRGMMMCVGAAVGLLAAGVQQFVLAEIPRSPVHDAMFREFGSLSLVDAGRYPSTVAFMVFFAALFGVRRWWWHADGFRKKRLLLRSVALTTLVGAILPFVWAFPVEWAVGWAVSISAIVQISASWVSPEDRPRLAEGK